MQTDGQAEHSMIPGAWLILAHSLLCMTFCVDSLNLRAFLITITSFLSLWSPDENLATKNFLKEFNIAIQPQSLKYDTGVTQGGHNSGVTILHDSRGLFTQNLSR